MSVPGWVLQEADVETELKVQKRYWGETCMGEKKREEAGLGKGVVSLGHGLDKTRSSGAEMASWRTPTLGRNNVTTLLSHWLRWTLEVLIAGGSANLSSSL